MKNEEYTLEKVPFPHCPYCDYWVLGSTANMTMEQHIRQTHPEKHGRLNHFFAKMKMSDTLNWELPQWFAPVWCESSSWRFWILLVCVEVALYFVTFNPIVLIGWFVGFNIFGWCFAGFMGVFDRD